MQFKALTLLIILCGMLCNPGCDQARPEETVSKEITVFGASSLRDVLSEVAQVYQSRETIKINLNFAGSNVLAQQITAGAKANIYISANKEWMDFLHDKGHTQEGTERVLLSNSLTIVANYSTDWSMSAIEAIQKIPFRYLSLGHPGAVPAGKYAKEYLQSKPLGPMSLWDALQDKVAPASNVRAALNLVESDPSVLGIVYHTDAKASKKVRILFEVPTAEMPINYMVTLLKNSDSQPNTKAEHSFYSFLLEPAAQQIYRRYGFTSVKDPTG